MNSKEIISSVFGVAIKIIVAVIVVMLVYKYAVTGYEYGYRVFGETPVSSGEGHTVTVTVLEGKSAKEIGTILEEHGLVRDATLFSIQERISEYHNQLKPGIYELSTAMTAEEMIAVMAAEPETETGDEGTENSSTEEMTDEQAGTETEEE